MTSHRSLASVGATSLCGTSSPWQSACDQVDRNPATADACLLVAVFVVFFGARVTDAFRGWRQ